MLTISPWEDKAFLEIYELMVTVTPSKYAYSDKMNMFAHAYSLHIEDKYFLEIYLHKMNPFLIFLIAFEVAVLK